MSKVTYYERTEERGEGLFNLWKHTYTINILLIDYCYYFS